MEHAVSTDSSKDCHLPLASLRLLVPPLQLMTASLWQVLEKQDVMNYWNVADFVSFVTNMVPELLMCKHRAQLELGLRARYILELCQDEELLESDILSHLNMMKSQPLNQMKEVEEEVVAVNFLELIQTLLKDPEERRDFFSDVFPVEYGRQYHSDLQTLFWEFLSRLAQLIPVPDLKQTMLWLRAESSLLEDCVHLVSKSTDLKHLLHHHKDLGHLEQHVPCAGMGESIISSLSSLPRSRVAKTTEQSGPPLGLSDEKHTVSFVDGVAVEIISVTDYSEVELGTSADFEVVIEEHSYDRTDRVTEEGKAEGGSRNVVQPEDNKDDSASLQHRVSVGPHDCPDCEKKFKFASSLNAHRVIHTGERPHRCNECGRCFSFRQSLERHRYTHKTGRKYDCAICGETFYSLSARTEHKQTHMEEGVYTRQQENRKFTWERANKPTEMKKHGGEAVLSDDDVCEDPNQPDYKVETEDKGVQDPENAEDEIREGATCWSEGLLLEPDNNQAPSTVKVRTSGRKRKPTMKIQAINLQKFLNRKGKTIVNVDPPDLKPLPLSCAEHSYGSPMDSPKHSDETVFSCLRCSFQHSDEVQVQQHMDSLHSAQPLADEQGLFSCSDCDKSFKFQSLLNAHQRIHTGEQPFLCSQCGRRFSFKQSLDRHKETHKSGRSYKCLICGEFFKSLVAQREHKNTHMENGAYLCSECGRVFTWKSALVRHMKTHGEDPDEGERPYTCPQCELSFSCASYLSRHLQTHQEARAHSCNCGKSFAYRAALRAHQRIHLKERPHACTQCGKRFLYRGGLQNHMKIHSSEMPFMCSFCGKSFKRERSLKKHERCHTRENIFKCSQCDKSFVYKATLTRHELTHSGERPFLCSDCGKGFFSHAELLKHERFHTGHKPFQCPHCGKKFTQSCYLTIHLRYHTGVRPYSCTECDKSFLSANRLKRHQRIHSGEKPFLCGECGKSFRQSYNLKMHQRIHSKK